MKWMSLNNVLTPFTESIPYHRHPDAKHPDAEQRNGYTVIPNCPRASFPVGSVGSVYNPVSGPVILEMEGLSQYLPDAKNFFEKREVWKINSSLFAKDVVTGIAVCVSTVALWSLGIGFVPIVGFTIGIALMGAGISKLIDDKYYDRKATEHALNEASLEEKQQVLTYLEAARRVVEEAKQRIEEVNPSAFKELRKLGELLTIKLYSDLAETLRQEGIIAGDTTDIERAIRSALPLTVMNVRVRPNLSTCRGFSDPRIAELFYQRERYHQRLAEWHTSLTGAIIAAISAKIHPFLMTHPLYFAILQVSSKAFDLAAHCALDVAFKVRIGDSAALTSYIAEDRSLYRGAFLWDVLVSRRAGATAAAMA